VAGVGWGWSNPHPRNFAKKQFPCIKIGMWMAKGISNYAKFVYPVRGGSVNMTISDMSQNSGQKYDINILVQIQYVLLKHALPIETSSGHMRLIGKNPMFLSVTVFAQFKFKVGHL
jgi:hypothetical protein